MEADASRYHGVTPEEADWSAPGRQTRAVAEFLGALDDDDPTADCKPPKVISLSDPCSAWTAKANKRVQFGYGRNYLIDTENGIVVDVEATPARTYDEVAAARTMIQRTQERMGLKPQRLAADTAYGTGKFLGWLVGAGITGALVPDRDLPAPPWNRALSSTSPRCAPCRRGQGPGRLHHNPSLLLEVMKLRHARLEQVGDIIPIPASQGAGMTVDYLAIAEHRLEKSRRVLERQRELIATRRAAGQPTAHSEKVLATFERTHATFERGLQWIVKVQETIDPWATDQQGRLPVPRRLSSE
jgi:hypothetical protein